MPSWATGRTGLRHHLRAGGHSSTTSAWCRPTKCRSHADLVKLLTTKAEKYQGKVTTYDIEKAGVGFTFITNDLAANPQFWDFAKTLGEAGVRVQSSTGTMLERISSGENLIGYNMLGSYALVRAKKDPSIGVSFPKDYTLVLSRVMFINKSAKNINAAKLWLDYVLSKRGQTIIANESQLFAIRSDVTGETTSAELTKQLGARSSRWPSDRNCWNTWTRASAWPSSSSGKKPPARSKQQVSSSTGAMPVPAWR